MLHNKRLQSDRKGATHHRLLPLVGGVWVDELVGALSSEFRAERLAQVAEVEEPAVARSGV